MDIIDNQKQKNALVLIFTILLVVFTSNSFIVFDPDFDKAPRLAIRDFSSIDNDSNIDLVANLGTNDSSYINTQSLDGLQQNLTEALTTPNFELPHTTITNNHAPYTIEENISIDNWGFEDGDATGWTVSANCFSNSATTDNPHEQTYAYRCETAANGQYLDLSIRYNITDYASDIINGSVTVNSSIWVDGDITSATDSIVRFGYRLLDSSQTLITTMSTDYVTTGSYVKYIVTDGISALNTRYYEMFMRYMRGSSSPAGLPKISDVDHHHIELQTTYGTYSLNSSMNLDDNVYNTLTEELESGSAGWYEENDVDNNAADVDSSADIGTETNFANAQGTTLDSSYMNIQEGNGDTYVAPNDVNDYHDSIANNHAPVDCGTYSAGGTEFDSAPDGTDETLTECNGAAYVEAVDINDYHDNLTDTDSGTNPDLGTYSNGGLDMDSAPDGTDETLTEENTGGGGGTNYFDPNADHVSNDCGSYTDVDDGVRDPTDPSTSGDGNSASCGGNPSVHYIEFPNIATTGLTSVNIHYFLSTGTNRELNLLTIYFNGVAQTTSGTCSVGVSQSASWRTCTVTTSTATNTVGAWFDITRNGGGAPDPVIIYAVYLSEVSSAPDNYEFDRELGWTGLDFDNVNEELCIFTGTIGAESLIIQVWDSGWTTLVTIVDANDDTWINTSISSYLTTSYFSVRFLGGTESSDTTQSTWNIDTIVIHTWTVGVDDKEFDREFSFTGLDFDEVNEYLAIFTGTIGSEALLIDVWTGSWTNIGQLNSSVSDQWVNISISTWLTSATLDFRFVGATETGDSTENTWDIDTVVIHIWSIEVLDYEINFEYQWTTANATPATLELAINAQNVPAGEDLDVWYWDSADWVSLGTITTNGWLNVTATGLTTTYTIMFNGTAESGDTTQDDWDIDLILISGEDADTRNHRFNREVNIEGIDTDDTYDNFELVINTGSLDAENLDVEIWNQTEGDWDSLFTLTSADAWTNTSLSQLYWEVDINIRFVDTTQTSDNGAASTWEIDYFGIHVWSAALYGLEWEHQNQDIETGCNPSTCSYFMFLYGNASEDMDVIFWDDGANDWYPSSRFTITSTLQWYNLTIPSYAVRENITWQYVDTNRTNDADADVLSIDYINFFVYNFTISVTEATWEIPDIPPLGGNISAPENPINIVIDSGVDFNVTISCVGCGSIAFGFQVNIDTDSNPVGAFKLNTGAGTVVLYSFQPYTTTNLQFWIFGDQYDPNGDIGFEVDSNSMTISIVPINYGVTV
ncbi:MAG: hypothetical protein ACW990_00155 [Promethearchaeota archaeon]|jgi:hypothetical protein